MKAVVTGSTGFIGKNLVNALIKQGVDVVEINRNFSPIECDRVYHLACPSSTIKINTNPLEVMDTILDVTRKALAICPSALFVNASSMGAEFVDVDNSPQNVYNIAKRSMEVYIQYSGVEYINYRIPSVYGEDAHSDSFVMRCILGTATVPVEYDKMHYIAHVDDVVDSLISLTSIPIEKLTLGQIYELFNSGRRGIYRTTSN